MSKTGEHKNAARLKALEEELAQLAKERSAFKKLYQEALKTIHELERGILTTRSEVLATDEKQLTLDVLGMLLGKSDDEDNATEDSADAPEEDTAAADKPAKRPDRGKRKRAVAKLPERRQVIYPEWVLEIGIDKFKVIGVDETVVIEHQVAGYFRSVLIRPRLVQKNVSQAESARIERELAGQAHATFVTADLPTHPLPKSQVGPRLLAETIVWRWADHMPLNRMSKRLSREGLPLARSTLSDWHRKCSDVVEPLIEAMWEDARAQPILYTDATGVRVQAKKRCRHAHFWAVIAPERHLLFGYSRRHKKADVDKLLAGFAGYLVADAHTVYDHLYLDGAVTEVGCWAHTRRYFHKTLTSQPDKALEALALINQLFRFERQWKQLAAQPRQLKRDKLSRPVVQRFFKWVGAEELDALEDTPLYSALTYAKNQKDALERFLDNGSLPLHNNTSELAVRREAIGRKNWLFLGNDRGGLTNARLVTLLASCELHDIEPTVYLMEILLLLPVWPAARMLELAPVNWKKTRQTLDVRDLLEDNHHWRSATNTLCEAITGLEPQTV